MKRDLDILNNILEHMTMIETYIKGVTEEQFAADIMRQDAVAKRLEAIGEDASKLSVETKNKAQNVPWRAIIGMRHRLVHNYGDTDLRIIWTTITKRIPELKAEVSRLIALLQQTNENR